MTYKEITIKIGLEGQLSGQPFKASQNTQNNHLLYPIHPSFELMDLSPTLQSYCFSICLHRHVPTLARTFSSSFLASSTAVS